MIPIGIGFEMEIETERTVLRQAQGERKKSGNPDNTAVRAEHERDTYPQMI